MTQPLEVVEVADNLTEPEVQAAVRACRKTWYGDGKDIPADTKIAIKRVPQHTLEEDDE